MTLNDAHAALLAATNQQNADVAALELGRQRLADTEADLLRLTAIDAESIARHAARVESQTREGKTGAIPTLVPSATETTAYINAERTKKAAALMVQNLEAAVKNSRDAVANATATLRQAVHSFLSAEIRADYDELRNIRLRVRELRERLLGVYLVAPETLSETDWMEIDQPKDQFSAEAMSIGMPMIGASIYDVDGPFGNGPRNARTRINAKSEAWKQQIAKLEQEGAPALATKDVAA